MTAVASYPTLTLIRSDDFISVPAAASTLINIGDLLWLNSSGYAESANTFPWNSGGLTATQNLFAESFIGVAMDSRLASDTSTDQTINVSTRGIYQYPCAALGDAETIGTLVNAGQDPASGSYLANQVIAPVTSIDAIGVVSRQGAVGDTVLEVRLQSCLLFGVLGG